MGSSKLPELDENAAPDTEKPPFRERPFTIIPPPPNHVGLDRTRLGFYASLISPRIDVTPPPNKTASTIDQSGEPSKPVDQVEVRPPLNVEQLRFSLKRRYQDLVGKLQASIKGELDWPSWERISETLTEAVLQNIARHFKIPIIVPIPPIPAQNLAEVINRSLKRHGTRLTCIRYNPDNLKTQNLYHEPTKQDSSQQWQVIIVEDPGAQNQEIAQTSSSIHNGVATLVKRYNEAGLHALSGIKQYTMLSLVRFLLYQRPVNDDGRSWTVVNPYTSAQDPKALVGIGETRDDEMVFSSALPSLTNEKMQVHSSICLLIPKVKLSAGDFR